ncbi:hypothetical protein BpHYR1_049266 [Brachionus plicatilis]|uniref:Uncharacterized protein n=1 Tax=Brachionus plicatilis TaxID=10195 RepID=A0A3M7R677_BRAPC|nr:hypothetical protein BpHYR1_049266 [Brachionus plicatilis]
MSHNKLIRSCTFFNTKLHYSGYFKNDMPTKVATAELYHKRRRTEPTTAPNRTEPNHKRRQTISRTEPYHKRRRTEPAEPYRTEP